MSIVEKIKTELKAFEEKKTAFVSELKKEFPALLKPIFDKSKKITSIGWTQYTPYFNDGDTCEFGVNHDDIYINGEDESGIDFLDWRMKYALKGEEKYKKELADNKNLDYEEYTIVEEFKEVLSSIPEEFYKDLFGDHAKITINADGTIETDEYEHE